MVGFAALNVQSFGRPLRYDNPDNRIYMYQSSCFTASGAFISISALNVTLKLNRILTVQVPIPPAQYR